MNAMIGIPILDKIHHYFRSLARFILIRIPAYRRWRFDRIARKGLWQFGELPRSRNLPPAPPYLESLLGAKFFDKGLDIGCARGETTIALTRYCKHVTGMDISRHFIEQAREHWRDKSVEFRAADIVSDEIEGDYDLVLCQEVLCYVPENQKEQVAAKLSKALMADGMLIIHDFNTADWSLAHHAILKEYLQLVTERTIKYSNTTHTLLVFRKLNMEGKKVWVCENGTG